ncbi:damage-inducible protein DinB [Aequorivita sp. F47161]|uniref:Damage-inducible protein DinB n=1 Tax=Aequorivita vitellina TaxID=2874475 RepID=A0A9X1QVC2_9FLAO|nr:DinB family protein [Aequorivita vitellina]MCG2419425.1 damage-inducible protein DinB [Aequorivita vitellina]
MKTFFKDKFEYTHHCNQQLIEVLLKNPKLYKSEISALMSHTLNAHHIWNHRIFGVAPALQVWQELELNYLQKINTENYEHSVELIRQKDLNEKIDYANSNGFQFKNTVNQMLFHIINHTTYHRAQLVSLLKTHGMQPINTDYIFYKR